ncbi:hypothetical protein FJTKL_00490 [Diaporthe vaccinii]|uniref:Uncharacterized protein n=1 Tax=Diaporthe vaccinii TaxID=105482 RepID=A0ABR4E2M8_9PEZI
MLVNGTYRPVRIINAHVRMHPTQGRIVHHIGRHGEQVRIVRDPLDDTRDGIIAEVYDIVVYLDIYSVGVGHWLPASRQPSVGALDFILRVLWPPRHQRLKVVQVLLDIGVHDEDNLVQQATVGLQVALEITVEHLDELAAAEEDQTDDLRGIACVQLQHLIVNLPVAVLELQWWLKFCGVWVVAWTQCPRGRREDFNVGQVDGSESDKDEYK